MSSDTATRTDEPLAYSASEVAALLHLHRSTIYELISGGRLKSVKLGPSRQSRRLIPRSELLKFLDEAASPQAASS
jgi:excisionase family DNA binding protein